MRVPRISKALLFSIGVATLLGLIVWSGFGAITQALAAVSQISFSSWILLLFLIVSMMLFHGLRWFFLLIGSGEKVRLRDLYPILFFSYFVNQFVPFRPGSPLRGVLGSKKLGVPFSVSILAIIIEEIFDVLVTGTLALRSLSILAPSGIFSNTQMIVLMILSAIVFLVILIFWWDGFISVVTKILLRVFPETLKTHLINSNLSLSQSIKHKRYLFGSFLLTIAYWTVRFELFSRILSLVNIPLGFATAATIISVSFLLSVLTMIPGGWGVKELTITMLLVSLSIDEQVAAAAALLDRAVLLIFISVVGGISGLLLGTEIRPDAQVNQDSKDHS